MTIKELKIGSFFVIIDRPAVKNLLFKKISEDGVSSMTNQVTSYLGLLLGRLGTPMEFDTPVLEIKFDPRILKENL